MKKIFFRCLKGKKILTEEEIFQLMDKSDSELSDFSDDDDDDALFIYHVVHKIYEPHELEGRSSSDEDDEGNISSLKTILDHPPSSKSPSSRVAKSGKKPFYSRE